jgi:hypothetical protein
MWLHFGTFPNCPNDAKRFGYRRGLNWIAPPGQLRRSVSRIGIYLEAFACLNSWCRP